MALKIYPNGLRLSITNKEGKLASVVLMITSGTQSEKNYEAGISEFTSRMLLMGTENHNSFLSLSSYAKSKGIILSTDNSSEYVILTAQTTSNNVGAAIELLCEIAFKSTFTPESGDRVRNAMLADIYKLQENPSYTLERLVNQSLFYRTGLANAKYGTVTTISRMTSSNAKEFLNRVLTPKNTILSVVGDVNADEVYESVMKTFYTKFINGGEYKKLKFVAPIENYAGGFRTKNKKLNQSRISFAFPSVSYKNTRKWALEIILPLLLRKIKQKLGDVTYFHSENIVNTSFANNGKLIIESMVDYDMAENYIDKVAQAIKQVCQEKLTDSEFEIEKNAFIINFLIDNDKTQDLAVASAREVAILKQSYSINSELMKIELLKVADANKILDEIFDFSKLFIAYIGNPITIDTDNYIN